MAVSPLKTLTIFRFKALFRIFILSLLIPSGLKAQSQLLELNSYFDDSAREWLLFGMLTDSAVVEEPEEIEGTMRIKWELNNDFSEWSIDYNEIFYTIKTKFGREDRWELRSSDNELVELSTKWRNDMTEWTVKYDGLNIKWEAEYKNDLNVWFFETKENGFFEMYTLFEGDSRDWLFEDKTKGIPDCVKMACLFITSYVTNPKQ